MKISKPFFSIVSVFVVVLSLVNAIEANAKSQDQSLYLEYTGQYRIDQLHWNISGIGGQPNVVSELIWSDLEIFQSQFKAELPLDNILVRMSVAGGLIVSGKNQDADYALNNRQAEFSRSNNDASDGAVDDFSMAVGFPLHFKLQSGTAKLVLLLGWARHRQFLTFYNGLQTFSDQANFDILFPSSGLLVVPAGTRAPDLDSTFDATWFGRWYGLELQKNIARWELGLTWQRTATKYEGVGNWNLRDLAHPVSFRQFSEGIGDTVILSLKTAYNSNWQLGLSATWQYWHAEAGIIRFFDPDGSTSIQPLPEAVWESLSVGVNVSYQFDGLQIW